MYPKESKVLSQGDEETASKERVQGEERLLRTRALESTAERGERGVWLSM